MPPRLPPSAHELVDVDLDTLAALQLFLGKSQAMRTRCTRCRAEARRN